MYRSVPLRLSILAAFIICGRFPWSASAAEPAWQPIFNGADLSGWKPPEPNRWWSVREGVLHGENDPRRKGSVLWTRTPYRDFMIALEFRMGEGTVDSGVFLRNNDQIQIGQSGSLRRDMTASPYIPGKGYPVEAEGVKELLKPNDWNSLRIKAVGPQYTVWLNGKQVVSYKSDRAIESGPIGLQIHPGRTMEIDFRNIRVAKIGE